MERLTERNKNSLAMAACCGKACEYNYVCEVGGFGECRGMDDIIDRLADIEDILSDDYELDRLRNLVQADRIVGKEIWSEARYLHLFKTKPGDIERSTVQYVSLLRDGNILCHTQTCAFPLDEIGRTVFLSRDEALKARD